jgi:hypothetical protein
MIVYDLICTQQHRFEGWFASSEDFARQSERTLVRCPICDDAAIERRPSVNVQVGRAAVPVAERETAPQVPAQIQAEGETLKALRQLIASSDNVGAGFAEEARKIHYEEVPKRSIRGQATREEAAELRDEGIEFMSLPSVLTRDLN